MSISGTFKVKKLNGVIRCGQYIEIDAQDIEIAETAHAEEIIYEYGAKVLLDSIGEDVVIKWLADNGNSIIDG